MHHQANETRRNAELARDTAAEDARKQRDGNMTLRMETAKVKADLEESEKRNAAAADEAIDAALVVLDGGKARVSGEAKVAAAAIAARLCAPRDMGAPAAAALRHTLLVLAEKKPRGSRLLKALQIFFFWL